MAMLHIIWDLDGTLINSEQEVLEALIKSVKDSGLSEKDQIAEFRVGPTIDKILDATFPKNVLTPEKKSAIIKRFRNNYDNCGFERTPPYEGIPEILSDKRFVHHVVTNKPDFATGRIMEKLNWNNYFANVITPYSFMKSMDDKKMSKTKLFSYLMKIYPNEKFVGVGDMATDAKAAIENNISAIGVLWGTGTKEEFIKVGCKYIVESVNELRDILGRL